MHMLSIRLCDDRHQWNTFLDTVAPHTFLQSWEWKTMNEALGHQVFALGIFDDERLIGTALTIFMKARRGSFLLIPHGPVIQGSSDVQSSAWILLREEWKKLAQTHRAAFIRVCPLLSDELTNTAFVQSLQFRPAPIHQHPELAWMVDVTAPEEELIKQMRKTTRQSLRKAEEAGMTVEFATDTKGLDAFWQVYQTTVARQQFTPFSRQYLETEGKAFAAEGHLLIAIGRVQGIVVSAAIVVFAHGSAFYHHGASDQSHFPKVPAAHLLQWRIMQEVKRRGCRFYNFWGVVPESATDHPWHGLSSFKRGFGGVGEAYVHAHDLPLSSRYWLTWLIETVRRKRRRL